MKVSFQRVFFAPFCSGCSPQNSESLFNLQALLPASSFPAGLTFHRGEVSRLASGLWSLDRRPFSAGLAQDHRERQGM